jgi:protein gp37
VSCEPLLEDIADSINLDGFGWMIVGGESGTNPEYRWNPTEDWRKEFERKGRRTMDIQWAKNLLAKARNAGIPFFFKQVTAGKSEMGVDALGSVIHEIPPAPHGLPWAEIHWQEPKGVGMVYMIRPIAAGAADCDWMSAERV